MFGDFSLEDPRLFGLWKQFTCRKSGRTPILTAKEVNRMARRSNRLLVPGAAQILNQFKEEIAAEFGVTLGPDMTSRGNGSVGGEITKRLVQQAQQGQSQ